MPEASGAVNGGVTGLITQTVQAIDARVKVRSDERAGSPGGIVRIVLSKEGWRSPSEFYLSREGRLDDAALRAAIEQRLGAMERAGERD
ncbi:MAG: hypothetical protein HYY96_11385 [Candidatus Tectomicrobia bacterium]|nr:hypothetical protein [Candidatus Tectomicrobia bacterium]